MAVMTVIELDSSALQSTVAFTGRLVCMTRAEAFEVVRSHAGTPSQNVTRRTNVLVVGELGWPLLDDGRPSNKLSIAANCIRATESVIARAINDFATKSAISDITQPPARFCREHHAPDR